MKEIFSHGKSQNSVIPILKDKYNLHMEWLPQENNEGNLNQSFAHATAMNAHHCIIIRALVRDKIHLAKAGGNEDTKNPIQAKHSG